MSYNQNLQFMTQSQDMWLEMVKRAPVITAGNPLGTEENFPFDNSFVADKGKVWDLISSIMIKTYAWPQIKHARKRCDGKKSMLEYHDPFYGPNNVDHIQK